MTRGGFAGNILEVDLGEGAAQARPLDSELCEKYIGGFGICVKLAYDAIRPGTDPLAPQAPLVLGAGPLVGTSLPASSRVYAVAKLPESGAVGWCGAGGMHLGCMMKNAGFDHVIVRGRAKRPVYLSIENGEARIRDASALWGLGVEKTAEALWDLHGRPAGVITIGPAGENLVAYAMAYVDRFSSLGRGGFGAVMGSKNLKAVVIRGSLGVRVAERKQYRKLHDGLMDRIGNYKYLKEWQDLGLVKSLPLISREDYFKVKKRRVACVSCPIGDKDVVQVPDGAHAGLTACSSSMANLCMPLVYGFSDFRDAIACITELDSLGMDMFEFFGIMQFARALADHGILRLEPSEPAIDLASHESMRVWARRIALRQGTGDLLAGGFSAILDRFGEKASEHAPSLAKNMLTYVGPRGPLPWGLMGTMELGQALDPRGPHVGASGSPTYFEKRPLSVFPKHLARMGVPPEAMARILPGTDMPGGEPTGLSVGRMLKYSQVWFAILGSLGLCARAQINRFYDSALAAELYRAVTGIPASSETLAFKAQRVWTLLRMANAREGFTRVQDACPEKWFQEPAFKDYLTGRPVTRADLDRYTDEYYDEQGWDKKTGLPTPERLQELGL